MPFLVGGLFCLLSLSHLYHIMLAKSSFQSHVSTLKAQALVHSISPARFTFGNTNKLAFTLKSLPKIDKLDFSVGRFTIKRSSKLVITAVSTLEPRTLPRAENEETCCNSLQSTNDQTLLLNQIQVTIGDSTKKLKRVRISSGEATEKLRRFRISNANKGNTPWNKGRKHSAETIQRIRERTRIAMQDPKVRMKVVKAAGHAQSKETRTKIGIGVQQGWEKRRDKLMLQETCRFEWENLIAGVSRSGFVGQKELQWDSYNVLDKKLADEWLESIQHRKIMPRPKGSKRTGKSPEQRMKISKAISAKWAESGYRSRVTSALAKYHGTPVRLERKPRRWPIDTTRSIKSNHAEEIFSDMFLSAGNPTSIQPPRVRPKRSSAPLYKDPLANSKLEMIKNIRTQRVAAGTKKVEAIERARLLIVEAEKASMALEVAAKTSPLARASLMETRTLIAKAIQSIESINYEQILSDQNSNHPKSTSTGQQTHAEQSCATSRGLNGAVKSKLTGNHSIMIRNNKKIDLGAFDLQSLLHYRHDGETLQTSSNGYSCPSINLDNRVKQVTQVDQKGNIILNGTKCMDLKNEETSNSNTRKKKWVCGKLIEVTEE